MDGRSGLSEEVTRKNEEEPVKKNNKQTKILDQQKAQRQKQGWQRSRKETTVAEDHEQRG